MSTVRKDPPRWSKLPVVAAAAVATWALLFVLWRAVVVWPWPTGCLFAGVLIGLLAGGRWRRQLRAELEAERATVDRWNHGDTLYALDEVGRIEPDRPEPVLFDQDAEYPLAEALGNVGRTIGEHAAPVADGSFPVDDEFRAYTLDVARRRTAEQESGPDDTWQGTLSYLHSGEWAPAAPAPKQVGQ